MSVNHMEKFAHLQLRQDVTEELRINGFVQVHVFFNTEKSSEQVPLSFHGLINFLCPFILIAYLSWLWRHESQVQLTSGPISF